MDLKALIQNLKSFFSSHFLPKERKKAKKEKRHLKLALLFRTEESTLIQIV